MIPPLRGLSNLEVSFGSETDVSMANADSVLGKRGVEEQEVQGGKLDLTLALNYTKPLGGNTRKGQKLADGQGAMRKDNEQGKEFVGRARKKAATGHGAPGNLTRPNVWSRQAQ
jgi:hypothetical protein